MRKILVSLAPKTNSYKGMGSFDPIQNAMEENMNADTQHPITLLFHAHNDTQRDNKKVFSRVLPLELSYTDTFDIIQHITNITHLISTKNFMSLNQQKEFSNHISESKDIQLYIRSWLLPNKEFISNTNNKLAINYIDIDIDFKYRSMKHKVLSYPKDVLDSINTIIFDAVKQEFPDTVFYTYPTTNGWRIILYYSPVPIEHNEFMLLKKYAFRYIIRTLDNKLQKVKDSIARNLGLDIDAFCLKFDKGNAMEVLRMPYLKYDHIEGRHKLYCTLRNDGSYNLDISKYYIETPTKRKSEVKQVVNNISTLKPVVSRKIDIDYYKTIDEKQTEIRNKIINLLDDKVIGLLSAVCDLTMNYRFTYYLSKKENRNINDILPVIILSYILTNKPYRMLEQFIADANIKQESFKGWYKKLTSENMGGLLEIYEENGEECVKLNVSLLKENIKRSLEWLSFIEEYIPEIKEDKDLLMLRSKIYRSLSITYDKSTIVESQICKKLYKHNENSNTDIKTYIREKMKTDLENFLYNHNKKVAYVVATTGLGKTHTVISLAKQYMEDNPSAYFIYVSPYRAINTQVKEKFKHERFAITTYQSLIEKAYRIIERKTPLINIVPDALSHTLFEEFSITLEDLIPKTIEIDKKLNPQIIFIFDEVHDLKSLRQMESTKLKPYDPFNIKAKLYSDLHKLVTDAGITDELSILQHRNKLITLTATPPVEVLINQDFKYILDPKYRTIHLSSDNDFSKLEENSLPSYIHKIRNHNKVLIYINNKRIQAKLKSILQQELKDYHIITLESNHPDIEQKILDINKHDKVVIISTAVIRAGFDSDIDYIVYYGLPANRDELLQVVGRIRSDTVHLSFVLAGDIGGRRIEPDDIKQMCSQIVDQLSIYYTVKTDNKKVNIEDIVSNENMLKLVNKANSTNVVPKTRDIETLTTIFDDTKTFYNYYRTSPVPTLPYTKIRKYELDNNIKLWDIAYKSIPIDIRHKYFSHADITLYDIVFNTKKAKKIKHTTRFKKLYQSINNTAYEMLLDRFSLTLMLNSDIDNRQKLLSKLSKTILTDIQYDPYSNLYYFTNEKGYMLIPIEYNKNTTSLAENGDIIDLIGYKLYSTNQYHTKAKEKNCHLVPQDHIEVLYYNSLVAVMKSGKRIFFVYKNLELLTNLLISDDSLKRLALLIFEDMRWGLMDGVRSIFLNTKISDISDITYQKLMQYFEENKHIKIIIENIFDQVIADKKLSFDITSFKQFKLFIDGLKIAAKKPQFEQHLLTIAYDLIFKIFSNNIELVQLLKDQELIDIMI